MPGGVSSPVRSFRGVGGKAFVAEKGDGAHLIDVDGNRYIDLVCSWGALIHGHAHPRISEAISRALQKGTSFGVTSKTEVELCEWMTSKVKGLEMVRLVNSGTEACMSAIRVARGATGRDLILKFDGTYHGHADSFLVAAGSGVATLQTPDSAGVPAGTIQNTLVASFNDVVGLQNIFSTYGPKIAAVILEVVCGNMGVVAPSFDFLRALRRLTKDHGSVLIFDEVMTGFRLGLSGSQDIYGIDPDLITLGKVMGGGMPVAAYGGSKELMKQVAPLGPVYQAGTLSGNPLGAAAGLASLELVSEGGPLFFQNLDAIASEWKNRLLSYARLKDYPVSVNQVGSMMTIFFRRDVPVNFAEAKQSDVERFKKFFWALLERGIYYPPSQFEACFLSSAHSPEVMSRVMEASIDALDEVFAE